MMTKEREVRVYQINNVLYRIETECKVKLQYKYILLKCILEKQEVRKDLASCVCPYVKKWKELKRFMTLREAENYLKELDKNDNNNL